MANALGTLENRWPEPHVRLRDVETHFPVPATNLFEGALQLAAAAPRLTQTIQLPGLTLLPSPQTPWPIATQGPVLTPEALDLLLQTHSPSLWLHHAQPLARLGFEPPAPWTSARSARRSAGTLWLRGPGFFEPCNGQAEQRLLLSQHIIATLEAGELPANPPPEHGPRRLLAAYYLDHYPILAARAASLRERARALELRHPLPPFLATSTLV